MVAPPQSGVVSSWVDDGTYGPLNGFAVVGPEDRVAIYDGTGPTPIASFTVDVASAFGSMSAEALILSTDRSGPDGAVGAELVLTAYSLTTGAVVADGPAAETTAREQHVAPPARLWRLRVFRDGRGHGGARRPDGAGARAR